MILENEIALGGSPGPAAYQIERSLRFNSADTAYLSRTPAGAGSQTTWTWSGWFKKTTNNSSATTPILFGNMYGSIQNRANFATDEKFEFIAYNGAFVFNLKPTQVFRDVGAWYHFVLVVDSTNATSSDRIRIYVNGSRVTAFDIATYPTQNANCLWNGANPHQIGAGNGANYFDGYMSEVRFIDGQALDATSFGQTDSATGVWVPKAYTGSYGQNGFYLPFNDNSTVLNLGRNRQTLTADPYFPYTTLLLNGNQPSGVTDTNNNVFKDSSSNNFTITRSGATNNTTQGTFSPFSQTGWSNYFDGTGDSVGCSTNAIAATGQFCFEAWVYQTSRSTTVDQHIFSQYTGGAGGRFYIRFNDTVLAFTSGLASVNGATTLNLNTWYHVVVTRDSSDKLRIFVNGVLDGSVTVTGSLDTTASVVGATASANYWFGYISNVRVVSGSIPTAYQTSSTTNGTSVFTPPTSPLTAVSGTSLLTCNANRFVDGSASPMTLTVNGNSSVQAFSPFAPTAAYSAATNGGSGYFDGAGDYLTAGAVTDWVFLNRFNVDFTISFWLFHPSASTPYGIISTGWNTTEVGFNIVVNNSGNNIITTFFNRGVSGSAASFDSSANLVPNAWNYVTITYTTSSKTVAFYINGAASGSGSNTGFAYSSSNPAFTLNVGRSIGGVAGSINNLNGYLSGLRILNGSIGSTTLPTEPPTNITNTSILLNFTNAGITDATAKNDLETVGNAQISTTQSKWGGSSMYFDQSSWLTFLGGPNLAFGTGDYTVEAWVNFSSITASDLQIIFMSGGTGGNNFYLSAKRTDLNVGTGTTFISTQSTTFSANTWYHVAACRSGTTLRLFVNGTQIGSNVTDSTNWISSGLGRVGSNEFGTQTAFGYIDDVRVSKFARYTGNFTVPQAQFAYNQADINVKQWVPNNFSVTAGVGNDSLVDSPTNYGTDTGAGGEVRGNYATLNPLTGVSTGRTLANGNLDISTSASKATTPATIAVSSGKWYWEVTCGTTNNLATYQYGIVSTSVVIDQSLDSISGGSYSYYGYNGNKISNTTSTSYGATFTNGDVIGHALDLDAGTLTFYKNGVSQGTAFTGLSGTFYPAVCSGSTGSNLNIVCNFGQRPFAYTAPSGFKALCTQNLPTPAIGASASTLANKNFDISLWTGNGTSQNIVNSGAFQPDLLWIKVRSQAYAANIIDSIRGAHKVIIPSLTNAEATSSNANGVTAFNSDGFSLGLETDTTGSTNGSGYTFVGWQWKANGAGVSNTAGSISSTVSANQTAGISVVTYTGSGTAGGFGHGLGVAPRMVIIKQRNSTWPWMVYHANLAANGYIVLSATYAVTTISAVYSSTPSSSVVNIGNNATVNGSASTYVAYCFAEVAGFSKFGTYTGNASADGPFVYCGFRPRFVMMKRTDSTSDWLMLDAARGTVNVVQPAVLANSSIAEITSTYADFLSNGFKLRDASTGLNVSGGTYIFMAFAEFPFQYARAR